MLLPAIALDIHPNGKKNIWGDHRLGIRELWPGCKMQHDMPREESSSILDVWYCIVMDYKLKANGAFFFIKSKSWSDLKSPCWKPLVATAPRPGIANTFHTIRLCSKKINDSPCSGCSSRVSCLRNLFDNMKMPDRLAKRIDRWLIREWAEVSKNCEAPIRGISGSEDLSYW